MLDWERGERQGGSCGGGRGGWHWREQLAFDLVLHAHSRCARPERNTSRPPPPSPPHPTPTLQPPQGRDGGARAGVGPLLPLLLLPLPLHLQHPGGEWAGRSTASRAARARLEFGLSSSLEGPSACPVLPHPPTHPLSVDVLASGQGWVASVPPSSPPLLSALHCCHAAAAPLSCLHIPPCTFACLRSTHRTPPSTPPSGGCRGRAQAAHVGDGHHAHHAPPAGWCCKLHASSYV